MITIDVSELQRWGGLLDSEVRSIGIRIGEAVAEEQAVVIAQARAVVPRGVTGNLAASIRPLGKALRRSVRAGSNKAFYARFQEFGTRKMAANPFLVVQANMVEQRAFEGRVERAIEAGEIYA